MYCPNSWVDPVYAARRCARGLFTARRARTAAACLALVSVTSTGALGAPLAAGQLRSTPGTTTVSVVNANADFRPPRGPFVSRSTQASLGASMRVRPVPLLREPLPPAPAANRVRSYRGVLPARPGISPPVRIISVPGQLARPDLRTAQGSRSALDVTLGAPSSTGINPWWAYEQDSIPGLGRFMVNVANSRNLVVQSDDMDVPHRWLEAAFRRTYNSMSQHDFANTDGSVPSNFGNGWTNTFDAHLAVNSGANGTYGITVFDIDGTRYDYTPTDSTGNTLAPPHGVHATLVPDTTKCTYYWTKKDGTQYHFKTPVTAAGKPCAVAARFRGTAGRPLQIYGRNAFAQLNFTYSWDGGVASSASTLNALQIAVDGVSNVATLTFSDFGGSCSPVQRYRLLSSLQWANGTTTYYKYDCSGNLTEVDKPNNFSQTAVCAVGGSNCLKERYAYGASHFLTAAAGGRWSGTLTDPNNLATGTDGGYIVFNPVAGSSSIASAQFVGVANPQIPDGYSTGPIQSTPPGVTTWRTAYFDQAGTTTTWHDTEGHQTAYAFDSVGRVVQMTHSTGSTTLTVNRGFDVDNNLTYETDYRNNRTDYAYDVYGNQIARADPAVTAVVNGTAQTIRPTVLYTYDGYENIVSYCNPTWSATNSKNWDGVSTPAACPTTPGTAGAPGPDVYRFSDQTGHAAEPYGELTDSYATNGYHTHYTYSGTSEGGTGGNAGLDFGSATTVAGDAVQNGQFSPSQQYVYDAMGQIVCANKGQGWGIVAYDQQERKIAAGDPDDASMTNVSCPKSPGLPGSTIVQRMTYFPDGRLATSQTPSEAVAGTSTAFAYDLDNDTSTVTHHFGGVAGVTRNWYDADDRLVEVLQPRDSSDYYAYPWLTRYFYDLTQNGTVAIGTATGLKAYGNEFKNQVYISPSPSGGSDPWTDSQGQTFDAVDRPTSSWEPAVLSASPIMNNYYDQPGSLNGEQQRFGLISQTTSASGETSMMHYDAMRRLVEKDYNTSTPQAKLTYDPESRIADRYEAGVGDEVIQFDALGNAASVTTPPMGAETAATTVSYGYLPNGWRSSVGVSGSGLNTSQLLAYQYRNDGKLTQATVNLNGVETFTYGYTAAGRRQTMTDPATGGLVPAAARRSTMSLDDVAAPSHAVAKFARVGPAPPDLLRLLGIERGTEQMPASAAAALPLALTSQSTMAMASFIEPLNHVLVAPVATKPRAIERASRGTKLAPLNTGRRPLTASVGNFVATRFDYDSYGRLSTETLPTGSQYTGLAYDPEGEIASYYGYGDATKTVQQIRNSFTVRGELQGQHYYPNGGATYSTDWPHFAMQNADGYNLPGSENIQSGNTLYTAYQATDDRSYTSKLYGPQNNYLQGYGWQVDASARETIGRWSAQTSPSTALFGSEQKSYDTENRLTAWTVLTQDPQNPTIPMSGWPVQGPNVNIKCNDSKPTSGINLFAPGTSITYVYGPNGRIAGNSVNNVGQASVKAQIHYDGGDVLFTTDSTGTVDKVRVGVQAIVMPNGASTMFDRDWNGSWVMTHSATGYSTWQPPDPNLQNCQPNNPPSGSTNYQPAGLPIQFANLTADTLTDGYNFFAGARTYDPAQSQWTTPDPSGGTRHDPISQMPFTWNRNNPVQYSDPTGYCSDPGGRGVRVCIDFFIPQAYIGFPFFVKGDDRGFQNFASADQDRYRVRVNVDFADQSVKFQIADTHTLNGTAFPGIDEGNKFHFTGPRDVDIEVRDACGYCYSFAGKISQIYANIHLHLNDDGSVSRTGTRRPYPADEGMSYSSKGVQSIFQGDALGSPAWGTGSWNKLVPLGNPGFFQGWDLPTNWNLPDIAFSDD